MSTENKTVYPDINALLLLYQNGDLPEDQMAFPYNAAPGKIAWAHKDELRKLAALSGAYPQANTQKAKK
jgi:hypothetical protein